MIQADSLPLHACSVKLVSLVESLNQSHRRLADDAQAAGVVAELQAAWAAGTDSLAWPGSGGESPAGVAARGLAALEQLLEPAAVGTAVGTTAGTAAGTAACTAIDTAARWPRRVLLIGHQCK